MDGQDSPHSGVGLPGSPAHIFACWRRTPVPAAAWAVDAGLRLIGHEAPVREAGAALLRSALSVNPFSPDLLQTVSDISRKLDPIPGLALRLRRLSKLVDTVPADVDAGAELHALLDPWAGADDTSEDWESRCDRWMGRGWAAAGAPLLAWVAWRRHREHLARTLLDMADKAGVQTCHGRNLQAALAAHRGNTKEARELRRASLDMEPGQPHLWALLAVEELPPPQLPVGRTVVCAQATPDTARDVLGMLLESTSAETPITLLVHGRTADDAESLPHHLHDLGGARLAEVVCTPTPIGVPAGRNWLAHAAKAREADYLAFVENPASLESGWLETLAGPLARDPQAASIAAQCGDGPRFFETTGEWSVRYLPGPDVDVGQYPLPVPCATTPSPCRIMRHEDLTREGGFDVRFTPDGPCDADMDLRLWRRGRAVLCHGTVRAGLRDAANRPWPISPSMQIKLDLKHHPDDVAKAAAAAALAHDAAWRGWTALAAHRLPQPALELNRLCAP